MDLEDVGAVSDSATWDKYLDGRVLARGALGAYGSLWDAHPLPTMSPGAVFEIGCGSSQFLALGATKGWTVSGVDYAEKGLATVATFLEDEGLPYGDLFQADIMAFDWKAVEGAYDLIVSFGFLEHFTNADAIVAAAATALKPGGVMLAAIPNLFSVNAALMKRYDPELWTQHIAYDLQDIDEMHTGAGLETIAPAHYALGYDQYQLMPWEKIEQRMPLVLYKGLRYLFSYLVQPAARLLLPQEGHRSYCSSIVGTYRKPEAK